MSMPIIDITMKNDSKNDHSRRNMATEVLDDYACDDRVLLELDQELKIFLQGNPTREEFVTFLITHPEIIARLNDVLGNADRLKFELSQRYDTQKVYQAIADATGNLLFLEMLDIISRYASNYGANSCSIMQSYLTASHTMIDKATGEILPHEIINIIESYDGGIPLLAWRLFNDLLGREYATTVTIGSSSLRIVNLLTKETRRKIGFIGHQDQSPLDPEAVRESCSQMMETKTLDAKYITSIVTEHPDVIASMNLDTEGNGIALLFYITDYSSDLLELPIATRPTDEENGKNMKDEKKEEYKVTLFDVATRRSMSAIAPDGRSIPHILLEDESKNVSDILYETIIRDTYYHKHNPMTRNKISREALFHITDTGSSAILLDISRGIDEETIFFDEAIDEDDVPKENWFSVIDDTTSQLHGCCLMLRWLWMFGRNPERLTNKPWMLDILKEIPPLALNSLYKHGDDCSSVMYEIAYNHPKVLGYVASVWLPKVNIMLLDQEAEYWTNKEGHCCFDTIRIALSRSKEGRKFLQQLLTRQNKTGANLTFFESSESSNNASNSSSSSATNMAVDTIDDDENDRSGKRQKIDQEDFNFIRKL